MHWACFAWSCALFVLGIECTLVRSVDCEQQNDTTFALVYGAPLLAYKQAYTGAGKVFAVGDNASPGSNTVFSISNLATPQDTTVVRPNTDTLYSQVFYDISKSDLEITVPAVTPTRYFSVAFYDPYGGNYINLGAFEKNTAGKYLLSPSPSSNVTGALVTHANPNYEGTIYAPTTIGIILYRILLKNSSSDLPVVQGYQRNFNVRSVPRSGSPQGVTLTSELFADLPGGTGEEILELTARLSQALPSADSSLIPDSTTNRLSSAGINNGAYQAPSCVNISAAYSSARESIANFISEKDSIQQLDNSWFSVNPSLMGNYNTNYVARAFIAQIGYLALQSTQAVYPTYQKQFSLSSNESYMVTFSGKPPLTDLGFWSLTMYTTEGYLVDNAINRYAVDDRGNLTYPNGTLIYGPGSSKAGNLESFKVLVQSQQPAAKWTSNWLPSPSTPGPFTMLLRFYGPEPAIYNGSYSYPLIVKGAAVSKNHTGSPTTSGGPSATTSLGEASAFQSLLNPWCSILVIMVLTCAMLA